MHHVIVEKNPNAKHTVWLHSSTIGSNVILDA